MTGLYPNDRGSSGMEVRTNYPPDISQDDIKLLDLRSFAGKITVVNDIHVLRRAVHYLEGARLLGFDTETRPSFRKGKKNKVSLLQLSDGDNAFLFRINRTGIPDELKKILSNDSIIKTGVAIHDDLKALAGISGFKPAGFIDLQKFVKDYGIESSGLKKLTAIVLGFRISKNQQVTDWEADELSEPQVVYAATDAWVCFEIYRKLTNHI